jgi:hypothetical protein
MSAVDIRASWSPHIRPGTLTRTGGVIAQVGTTHPATRLTLTPIESMTLPASERSSAPTYARPSL